MTCRANLWATRASSQVVVRFLSLVSTVGMVEFWRMEGRIWSS